MASTSTDANDCNGFEGHHTDQPESDLHPEYCDQILDEDGNVLVDEIHAAPLTPYVGMMCETYTEAYEIYNSYAKRKGFSVKIRYTNRNNKTQQVRSGKFCCQKEGVKDVSKALVPSQRARDDIRCACPAFITFSFVKNELKYVCKRFEDKHNHALAEKEATSLLRSHRKITPAQGLVGEIANASGISLKSTIEFMATQAGGKENLGITKDDLKRHLRTKRQKAMRHGEASELMAYFQEQGRDNPSFYYAYQLDDDELITNIFWADPKMIVDYSYFGEVVSFDTTYKTNRLYRPVGVFAGLNHHRQVVIFGGTLMYDETIGSFEWLFRTFLHCMSDKKPATIFTDQAEAMASAIVTVMPETYHGLCSWHIGKNLKKHLGHIKKEGLGKAFNICMYAVLNEDQFEEQWKKMLDEFSLHDNEWLKSKYKLRKKWSHAFMKNTITNGIRSTQISESINADLKDYVLVQNGIVEFFTHFNRVVTQKRFKEIQMDFLSRHRMPSFPLQDNPFFLQASSVYTPNMYKKVQAEYAHSLLLNIYGQREARGNGFVYVVGDYRHPADRMEVFVCKETETVTCECGLYDMARMLCSHQYKVLSAMQMFYIPKNYIHRRWTKEARFGQAFDFRKKKIDGDPRLRMVQRYQALGPVAVRIASRAAESEIATEFVASVFCRMARMVEEIIRDSDYHPSQVAEEEIIGSSGVEVEIGPIENEEIRPSKTGHPKGISSKALEMLKTKSRIQSWAEQAFGRKNIRRKTNPSKSNSRQSPPVNTCSQSEESPPERQTPTTMEDHSVAMVTSLSAEENPVDWDDGGFRSSPPTNSFMGLLLGVEGLSMARPNQSETDKTNM